MKAIVIYESIFGNTKHIAEAIGRGLSTALDVETFEASAATSEVATRADLLVVGGPTHAWSMSRRATRKAARQQAAEHADAVVSKYDGIREWLDALPAVGGALRHAATFDTTLASSWAPTGSAARSAARQLRRRHYVLLAEPERFVVEDVDGPLRDGEIDRAERFGVELARRVSTSLAGDLRGEAEATASR